MKRAKCATPEEAGSQPDTLHPVKAEEPVSSTKRCRTVSKVDADAEVKGGPFPSFAAPAESEVRAVHAALAMLHPEVVEEARRPPEEKQQAGCGSRHLVLDALVGTILSQNTTDVNSHRAFAALKAAFPTWEEVRLSPPGPIEEAIKSGGLAAIKTERIQVILNSLYAEHGECTLEHLRMETDDEVKRILRSYKGVGAKTISCVLMFCLKRFDFPVDTHVWKIALNLGWVPKGASRDQTYDHLNQRVPDKLKYELHVLLVKHGKVYKNDVKALRATMRELREPVGEIIQSGATEVKTEAKAQTKSETVKAEIVD